MSSKSSIHPISPSDLKTIQSVVDQAGYDANSITSDQSLFDQTALLMMKPLLGGKTSPYPRAAHNFHKATDKALFYNAQLPSYAIQGLPRKLSKCHVDQVSPRQEPNDVDVQAWENEGGAVNSARVALF